MREEILTILYGLDVAYEAYSGQVSDIAFEFEGLDEVTPDSIVDVIFNLTQNAYMIGGEEGHEQGRRLERLMNERS